MSVPVKIPLFVIYVFAASALLLLVSCGSGGRTGSHGGLTPELSQRQDISNQTLQNAIEDYLKGSGAPVASRYSFARHDLDGDGFKDALVYMKNPYGFWCEDHGCTLLVMKAEKDGFSMVSHIRPLRNPLYINGVSESGWRDLVVRVAGGQNKAKYVRLQNLNGEGYPQYIRSLSPFVFKDKTNAIKVFP